MKSTKPRKWRRTAAEYRRIIGSIPGPLLQIALASFCFTSASQKAACVEALREIESQPGFAGWRPFTSKPRRGQVNRAIPLPKVTK